MTFVACYPVWAFDTDPYTYAQAPAGTTSVQAYGLYRESTNYTFSGSSVATAPAGNAKNSKVESEVAYTHITSFFEVDGVMIDPHVIIPYASLNHAMLSGYKFDGSTGWGDPMVALVIAPIHTPDNSQVLGLGIGEYLPIGQYEPGKYFNLGENRWKSVIQLDGIQKICPEWYVTGSIDSTFYGHNSQGGNGGQLLTQQNSYQIQPWIRYEPVPYFSVALGYSQIYGGKQFQNGVEDGIDTDERQIRMDFALALAKNVITGLQIARDMAVDGGYRESIYVLSRLTVLF